MRAQHPLPRQPVSPAACPHSTTAVFLSPVLRFVGNRKVFPRALLSMVVSRRVKRILLPAIPTIPAVRILSSSIRLPAVLPDHQPVPEVPVALIRRSLIPPEAPVDRQFLPLRNPPSSSSVENVLATNVPTEETSSAPSPMKPALLQIPSPVLLAQEETILPLLLSKILRPVHSSIPLFHRRTAINLPLSSLSSILPPAPPPSWNALAMNVPR